MQCDKSEKCPARKHPEKPCWEIVARNDDDYRHFFNVCRDCIVHVLKTGSTVLSGKEIKTIVKKKTGGLRSRDHLALVPQTPDRTTASPG